ncbi:MAG: hypothetical protein ICV87_11760 [Gemmatimonadetes bacterium]|nr:hypothetical protein [Gemmatimonadota bacterium]
MSDSFFLRGAILALACATAGCVEGDGPVGPTDSVAPQFTISHEYNATNQTTTTIPGSVTDSVGVARVTVRVNGGAEQPVTITPGTTVSFSATVPVPAAVNVVEFAAYDAAGNRGSETLEVRYDVTPPELSVMYLSNGGKFSSFFRVEGSATDVTTGVRSTTYSVNGGPEQSITGGYYSSSPGVYAFRGDAYGLPMGESTLAVYAYDRAGNRGQLQAVITRVQ